MKSAKINEKENTQRGELDDYYDAGSARGLLGNGNSKVGVLNGLSDAGGGVVKKNGKRTGDGTCRSSGGGGEYGMAMPWLQKHNRKVYWNNRKQMIEQLEDIQKNMPTEKKSDEAVARLHQWLLSCHSRAFEEADKQINRSLSTKFWNFNFHLNNSLHLR